MPLEMRCMASIFQLEDYVVSIVQSCLLGSLVSTNLRLMFNRTYPDSPVVHQVVVFPDCHIPPLPALSQF